MSTNEESNPAGSHWRRPRFWKYEGLHRRSRRHDSIGQQFTQAEKTVAAQCHLWPAPNEPALSTQKARSC